MLQLAHRVLVALYLSLPPAAIVVDILRARRRKSSSPSGSLMLSIFTAIPLGITVPLLYAYAVDGKVRVTQLALAVYFAAGLLLLLRAFDGLLRVPSLLLRRRERSA